MEQRVTSQLRDTCTWLGLGCALPQKLIQTNDDDVEKEQQSVGYDDAECSSLEGLKHLVLCVCW